MKFQPVLFCVLLLAGGAGCAVVTQETSPSLAATVSRVAANYLTCVASGNEARMGGMVYWDGLLKKASSDRISQEQFRQQLRALSNRWTPAEHPLLQLEIIDVAVSGDFAKVKFRKSGRKDYPVITVQLAWSGTGWVVSDDSIFGRDKLAQRVVETGSFK